MNNVKGITREEFEGSAKEEVETAVIRAKEIRESIRLLEEDIAVKGEKIRKYQTVFQELQTELVKVQAILYANGTI